MFKLFPVFDYSTLFCYEQSCGGILSRYNYVDGFDSDGHGCRYYYRRCFYKYCVVTGRGYYQPFLGIFGGMNFDKLHWNIVGDVTLNYGKFLTAVMNFLIMAFVVFILVKALNTAARIAPLS